MDNPNLIDKDKKIKVDMPIFPLPPLVNTQSKYYTDNSKQNRLTYPYIQMPPIFPMPGGYNLRPRAQQNSLCKVRFLHAAAGYSPVTVAVGNKIVAANLAYGNISDYSDVNEGFHIVTVMSTNSQGQVLLRKEMAFKAGDMITIAIINTATGIGLEAFSDNICSRFPSGLSCLRVANLSYNSMPFYLLLDDNRIIFTDIAFKEATSLKRISPYEYNFTISEATYMPKTVPNEFNMQNPMIINDSTPTEFDDLYPLLPVHINVKPNMLYTIYIIGLVSESPELQAIVVETHI